MDRYKIYLIKNNINSKEYVGQTKNSLEHRFKQHSYAQSYIGRSIRKHGKEHFTIECLEMIYGEENANNLEELNVKKHNCFPNGYNLTNNGRLGIGKRIHYVYDFKDIEFKKQVFEENINGIYLYYLYKAILYINSNYCLMKNSQTPIRTWEGLYDKIGITSRGTRAKFKNFCIRYKLIIKNKEKKKMEISKDIFEKTFF